MLDETHAGACRDPAKLKMEIESALDGWAQGLEPRLFEMPVAVIETLLRHTEKRLGFAGYITLMEWLSDHFALTAGAMRDVLDEDEKKRLDEIDASQKQMH